MRCFGCGYELGAAADGTTCPECGSIHAPDKARRGALAFLRTRRMWLPSIALPPTGFWEVLQRGDPRTGAWNPRLFRLAYAVALGLWFFVAGRVVLIAGVDPSSGRVVESRSFYADQNTTQQFVCFSRGMKDGSPLSMGDVVLTRLSPEFVSLAGVLSMSGDEQRTYFYTGCVDASLEFAYPGTMLAGWADRAIILDRTRPLSPDVQRAAVIALGYLLATALFPFVLRVAVWSRRDHWSEAPGEELLRRDGSIRAASVATTWLATIGAGSTPILVTGALFVVMAVLPAWLIGSTLVVRHILLALALVAPAPVIGTAVLWRGAPRGRWRRSVAFLVLMLLVVLFSIAASAFASVAWTYWQALELWGL